MKAYAGAFGVDGRNAVELAADIVSAYVSNNPALPSEMPGILAAVHAALVGLRRDGPARKPTAASIRKSVTREALISFEDGKPYKTLRRHLGALGLTPELYREKWGLPRDYPLVAAGYSAARSASAKRIGFGQPRRAGAPGSCVVARASPDAAKRAGTAGVFAAAGAACIPEQAAAE
ncbi:MucR family transcriptional regulator [Methylobacterium sp. J-048]|uniref:MucR family transcriptional regulator n=1 Tax=Methylobacterium sp. J-048 TaxID=2836635 RepID=UPI001FB953EF|nr:MucR family transcriptional regulator [Methylobacterium sp. J-048]MCJ2059502.1 MucR family transcriptional regulator [Methylobacterium sp. J-048]